MTRIFVIFAVLAVIICADSGTAPGGSAGNTTEETGLTNRPMEQIASEFRKLRKIKGHFDGGAWNDAVDDWMGRKHRLMIELGSRLSEGEYKEDDIIRLLGQPDRIAGKGDDLFKLIIIQTRYEPSAADSYEFLVYYWRGKHDFLFFTCKEKTIVHSGWWYAGE